MPPPLSSMLPQNMAKEWKIKIPEDGIKLRRRRTGEKTQRMKRTQSRELGLVPHTHVRSLTTACNSSSRTLMLSSDRGHPRTHRTHSCTHTNKNNNKIIFLKQMGRRFARCHLSHSERSVWGSARALLSIEG